MIKQNTCTANFKKCYDNVNFQVIFIHIINFVNYHTSTDILTILFFIRAIIFQKHCIGMMHCLSISKSILNDSVTFKFNENK